MVSEKHHLEKRASWFAAFAPLRLPPSDGVSQGAVWALRQISRLIAAARRPKIVPTARLTITDTLEPRLTMKKGSKDHGRARCKVPLRPTAGGLRGRAGPGFGLPLPRLSAPQWQRIRRPSALAGGAGHAERDSQDLGPCGRQRPSSDLPLLPRLWFHGHLPGGRMARGHGRADRRLRGSDLPAASFLRL
jgi:hypothetical protein